MRKLANRQIHLAVAFLVASGMLSACSSSQFPPSTPGVWTSDVRPSVDRPQRSARSAERTRYPARSSGETKSSPDNRNEGQGGVLDHPASSQFSADSPPTGLSGQHTGESTASEGKGNPVASANSARVIPEGSTDSTVMAADGSSTPLVTSVDAVTAPMEPLPPVPHEEQPEESLTHPRPQQQDPIQQSPQSAAECQGEKSGATQQQGAESSGGQGAASAGHSGEAGAGGTQLLPELTVPTGGMTSSDASQNPSGTAEPPVFRDGGTGTSDEQSPDSLGAGGTSDAEPGSDESTAGEHAASGVDSGSEDGGESLPVIAGSADAFNVPGERAKDADWAVHPESIEEAGGTQVEQEGHGGGLAGDSTGGLAGASGGGSDGSGEGQGGGGIPTEAVEAPDNGDMVEQQPGPTSMTAAGTPGNGDEPEDGSIGGQTDETAARDELPTHSQPEVLEAPGSSEEPSPNGAEVLKPDERSPTLPATPTVEQRGLPQVESPPRGSIPLSPSDLVELTSPPQPMGSESWYRQVRGAWQLVAIHDPHLDFLPGGASQRFIGIDPEGEVLRAILAWNGDLAFTVAAEYYVGFRPRIVDIQPVPHAPSKFTDPGPLVGDGTFVPAISKPPCELQWVRTGDRLTIGGGEYQAVAPDAMIELLSQPEPIDVLSGGFAGMSGEGERAGPAAATVDFFGVQAEGKYFCYIVDVSASMAGNGGMLRLRTELERSLASLPPGTRFSVLPFSDTLRDLQSQWTSANASKVRSIGHRLSGIRAAGGTNPTGAFTWAFQKLKPQPDAIFFMTDGNMGGGAGDVLTQLNRLNASNPRTRIHTIGLGDNADISFLERVAEKHGGTYRSVH